MNHPSCLVQKNKKGNRVYLFLPSSWWSWTLQSFLCMCKEFCHPCLTEWVGDVLWEGSFTVPNRNIPAHGCCSAPGWETGLRSLGWEACEICRSGTPGDSPTDYLESVGKAISDRTAAPRAVLGSATWLPYGLGHVTSSLFLLHLCPHWVHCVGGEVTLPLHIEQTLLLAKRTLLPCHVPSWDHAFSTSWRLLELAGGLYCSELTLLNFAFHSFGRRDR